MCSAFTLRSWKYPYKKGDATRRIKESTHTDTCTQNQYSSLRSESNLPFFSVAVTRPVWGLTVNVTVHLSTGFIWFLLLSEVEVEVEAEVGFVALIPRGSISYCTQYVDIK